MPTPTTENCRTSSWSRGCDEPGGQQRTRTRRDAPQATSNVNGKVGTDKSGDGQGIVTRKAVNGREVRVKVRLLPETRLLVALANEEVEARRKAGQSEAKIWKDCQRAPLSFVKRGFKRLLNT
jgi:hypothetical protein